MTYKEIKSVHIPLILSKCGIAKKKPILLRGPIGCGKTALVQRLAYEAGRSGYPSFVTVQLGEHMDGKSLLGTYQCSEVPGEFEWVAGPLTKAVIEGHWLLLEDLESASVDVQSSLTPLLKNRAISLPDRSHVRAHKDFQLFATLRTGDLKMSDHLLGTITKDWLTVDMKPLENKDMKEILEFLFPNLHTIIERLLEIFDIVAKNDSFFESRQVSFRDLIKLFRRISTFVSLDNPASVFQEAIDCFAAHIRKERHKMSFLLGTHLNMSNEKIEYYVQCHKPSFELTEKRLIVGRATLKPMKSSNMKKCRYFAHTRPALLLLEQLAICVQISEPVLLVGETGCGKTMSVQVLANCLGKTLHVINMSQQSENADLMGGYKPIDVHYVAKKLKLRYIDLFSATYSLKKNEKFLKHITTCFESSNWEILLQLMMSTSQKALSNPKNSNITDWLNFHNDLLKMKRMFKRAREGLLLNFVEGILIKAIKNGDWILLDEINLASAETLDCLNSVLDSQSRNIVFSNQNDAESLMIHSEFRLFACMNPSTDVGKRELVPGIRNRFTEIFVDESQTLEDLSILVDTYLKGVSLSSDPTKRSEKIDGIVSFYMSAKLISSKMMSDSWGHFPTFSLRTLCRALQVVKNNADRGGNITRLLYEAFCVSFLTELDAQSYKIMKQMIQEKIIGKNPNLVKSVLSALLPTPTNGKYINVQGYWLKAGRIQPACEESYILTTTVKRHLTDVARVISSGPYPVLLQGETSVGKTSLIRYLAKITGNHCVRINNHEHTDLQEYIGTYVTDCDGRLKFVEGPLVQAMKEGHWIILDELNLAPPDVLEALNRVLDDNRELFIAETQEVAKAHPAFILFATQNPYGLYGGRKQLSRAFRNRFVELHFTELPFNELEQILQLRCQLPLSYAKKMVNVMQDLQIYRSSTGLFAGRESYMTLRDLFRWGERYRLAKITSAQRGFYDWDQYLADQGYFLLAGRSRRLEDLETVCNVLQKRFGKKIDPNNLFSLDSSYLPFNPSTLISHFPHVVWTYNFRRLAILTSQSLLYNEPVLLIGETGCGKTTLCQMLAVHNGKKLNTVNCHMMSEAADFLGRITPANKEKMMKGILFEWRNGPLVSSMLNGEPMLIDEISLADDSVLERLNSVLEPEKSLLLSEMGADSSGQNCFIQAKEGFHILATMNPGGDYGKKELSRALRNRFTEVWCDSDYNKADIISIVEQNIKPGLRLTQKEDGFSGFGSAIFDFSLFLSTCSMNSKMVITVRDILSWVHFINRCCDIMTAEIAYIHGAFATFLDGYGCSINSSYGKQDKKLFIDRAIDFLCGQIKTVSNRNIDRSVFGPSSILLKSENGLFGSEPFYIERGNGESNSPKNFCFDAPTCSVNVFRILRAMQTGKPVLIEGSPGVGKSSVVVALAKASGNTLTRINLSEQTDLTDLFGNDVPITLENGEQGFAWVDGPLLSAIKQGQWVLIDEMNLASQSILEGLNACFDHRKEIFIPQLGLTFAVDSRKTKFFACQNPYREGASRKGLPKSFLNRFTMVFVDQLETEDLFLILNRTFPDLDGETLNKMIKFNTKINVEINDLRKWGQVGSPWEFNLRDMMRWCDLIVSNNMAPSQALNIIYIDRLRTETDRYEMIKCFEDVFECSYSYPSLIYAVTPNHFIVGDASVTRLVDESEATTKDDPSNNHVILRSCLNPMRSLMHCMNRNHLTILVGPSGIGKSALVQSLAKICNKKLRTFYLTSETDSSDLLGCFEQFFSARSTVSKREIIDKIENLRLNFVKKCSDNKKYSAIQQLFNALPLDLDNADLSEVVSSLETIAKLVLDENREKFSDNISELKQQIEKMAEPVSSKAFKFAWFDSPLVEALRSGDWLLVKNVHFCSPAVLDRLNSLLEPDGELTIAEKGLVDGVLPIYKPHRDFRVIFTMEPDQRSISRAMRNRAIEIYLPVEKSWLNDYDDFSVLLKHHFNFADDVIDNVWVGFQHLKMKGVKFSSGDIFKIGFIIKQFEKIYPNVKERAAVSFKIVTNTELSLLEVKDDQKIKCREPLTLNWLAKNPSLTLLRMDSVFFTRALSGMPKNESYIICAAKHFLLNASSADYSKRIKVCNKLLNDQRIKAQFLNYLRILKHVINLKDNVVSTTSLPIDPRWHSPALMRVETCAAESRDVISCYTRNFMHLLIGWVKIFEFKNFGQNSLLFLINDVCNGKCSKESLPDKTLIFLQQFFHYFFDNMENFVTEKSFFTYEDWRKVLLFVFYFVRIYALVSTTTKNDWYKNSVKIRTVWNLLMKYSSIFITNFEEFGQICQQISQKWFVQSKLSKIYHSCLKLIDMKKPWDSKDEFDFAFKVEKTLNFLNKHIKICFDDNNQGELLRLLEIRRKIIRDQIEKGNMAYNVESVDFYDLNSIMAEKISEDFFPKDQFIALRKDVLSNCFMLLWNVANDDTFNDESNEDFVCTALCESFGYIDLDLASRKSVQSPGSKIFHFVHFMNYPSPLDSFLNSETESYNFKISNLLAAPVVTLTTASFLLQNYSTSENCRIPLSKINEFKENLSYLSSSLWSIGAVLPRLDGFIQNFINENLRKLFASFEIEFQDIPELIETFASSQKLIDFGRILCRLFVPPPNSIDYIVMSRVKHDLHQAQSEEIDNELNVANDRYMFLTNRKLMDNINYKFCVPEESLHPYFIGLLGIKTKLVEKLSKRKCNTYYRPDDSKFDSLVLELRSFYENCESITCLLPDQSGLNLSQGFQNNELRQLLSKMQSFLLSSGHFVERLLNEYFEYVDVIEPFLLGVNIIQLTISQQFFNHFQQLKRFEASSLANVSWEEVERLYCDMIRFKTPELVHFLTYHEGNIVTTKDKLMIIKLMATNRSIKYDDDSKIESFCLNKLLEWYSSWICEQESNDRYYEYKSRESVVPVEQEEAEINSLFPNFDPETGSIFDDAYADPSNNEISVVSDKIDEKDFVSIFKLISFKESDNTKQGRCTDYWSKYFLASKCLQSAMPGFSLNYESSFYDSYLLACKSAFDSFCQSQGQNSHQKLKINVYEDCSLFCSNRMKILIDRLIDKIRLLLNEWPENAILIQIIEVCQKIFGLPANTPLIKLIGVLEYLLDITNEWEIVAAKHVKLELVLAPIRSLLIEWRKLEIQGWEQILDRAKDEFENDAALTVLKFALVAKSFNIGEVSKKEFLAAYTNLFAFCPLGQYEARLETSKCIGSLLNNLDQSTLLAVNNIQKFFYGYHAKIAEKTEHLRAPIEKQLKDFIKIVKFQDLNVYRAKETGRHAHRQLFKFIRDYKTALKEPVSSIIDDVIPITCSLKSRLSNVKTLDNVTYHGFPSPQQNLAAFGAENCQKLFNYFKKFADFSSKISTSFKNQSEIFENLDDAQQLVEDFYKKLRENINYTGSTKEENEKLYQRAAFQRRNKARDLFELLKSNKFRYRRGLIIDNLQLDESVFEVDKCQNTCESFLDLDKLFWIVISHKNVFDAYVQKPHEQINRSVSEQCSGYSRIMLAFIIEQRRKVANFFDNSDRLMNILTTLDILEKDPNAIFVNFYEEQHQLNGFLVKSCKFLANIEQLFSGVIDLWKCNSAEICSSLKTWPQNSLAKICPRISTVGETDSAFQEAIGSLEDMHKSFIDLHNKLITVVKDIKKSHGCFSSCHKEMLSEVYARSIDYLPMVKDLISISCLPDNGEDSFLSKDLRSAFNLLNDMRHEFDSSTLNLSRDSSKVDSFHDKMPMDDQFFADFVETVYLKVQNLYKKFNIGEDHENDDCLIFEELEQLQNAFSLLDANSVIETAHSYLKRCSDERRLINPLISPVFKCYLNVHETLRDRLVKIYVRFSTFYSSTLDAWITLLKEGFIKPLPIEDNDKSGGETKFEDLQDAGMGEGEGAKDISEQIEDLGQVEGLQEKKNDEESQKNEDDSKKEDVEKPIEMDEDLDAALEDIKIDEEKDAEESDEDEKEEQEDIDWQAGDAENPEEDQLDPNLWDDREEAENPEMDDKAEGADTQSENLVAKNDANKPPEADKNEDNGDQNDDNKEEENDKDMENIDTNEVKDDDSEDEEGETPGENLATDKIENAEENINEDETEKIEDEINPSDSETTPQNPTHDQNIPQSVITHSNFGSNQNEDQKREESQQQATDHLENDQETLENDESRDESRLEKYQQEIDPQKSDKGGLPNSNFSTKRTSDDAEREKETPNKRPKFEDIEKSLGDVNLNVKRDSSLVDRSEPNQADLSSIEINSSTFTHSPNLNQSNGSQIYDSAPIEVARKQVSEKNDDVNGPNNVDMEQDQDFDKENKSSTNEKQIKPMDGHSVEMQEYQSEPIENEEIMATDDFNLAVEQKPSTIHTGTDFYAQFEKRQVHLNLAELFEETDKTREPCSSKGYYEKLWAKLVNATQALSAELSENLRLTLEPTLATKYEGDYRSGKRLNVRKLIPYVASYYRKNKIWLRRTKKAKRDYQIMLAIDDSSSMNDNKTKQLAFESLALLSSALRYLETGQLAVCKFGENAELLQSFFEQFDDERATTAISRLKFEQKCTNIVPLLEFCVNYFGLYSRNISSANDIPAQLLLIVSDGRGIFAQGVEKVKSAIKQASSRKIFIVFIVLDNPEHKDSIIDIKVPVFHQNGPPEIKSYMESFPFAFYIILRRVNDLPAVLGDALRQWFEIFVAQR